MLLGRPPEVEGTVECGRVSRENQRGWTARLTDDDEVAVYFAECDERFGSEV